MPSKPKPTPELEAVVPPPALPEAYRATTDLFIPGIGTVPANGVIEVDPSDPAVTTFIAQGLLVN